MEAAKKVLLLVTKPLRGGSGGKGLATLKTTLFEARKKKIRKKLKRGGCKALVAMATKKITSLRYPGKNKHTKILAIFPKRRKTAV